MDAARDESARRSVVPEAAGRSLWLAAVWTGVGAAAVCATLAIVAVAICWLPVSGASGHSMSAVRAGLLTFLAGLHGGITVDGTSAQFLPLGLTIIVGLTAWRAGAGLADAAAALDERDRAPARRGRPRPGGQLHRQRARGGAVRAPGHQQRAVPRRRGGGSACCSAAPGGVAFVRASAAALRELVRPAARVRAGSSRAPQPPRSASTSRSAPLLVAGSSSCTPRVEALSRQVGGGLGWRADPAARRARRAERGHRGIAYLVGPGFAVGSGTSVNAFTTTHGVFPAFPILGCPPERARRGLRWSGWPSPRRRWSPVVVRRAVVVPRGASWRARFRDARLQPRCSARPSCSCSVGRAAAAIGGGRLRAIGPSPWQLGAFAAAELAVVAVASLARRGLLVAGGSTGAEGTQGSGGTVRRAGLDDRAEAEAEAGTAPPVTGTVSRRDDEPTRRASSPGRVAACRTAPYASSSSPRAAAAPCRRSSTQRSSRLPARSSSPPAPTSPGCPAMAPRARRPACRRSRSRWPTSPTAPPGTTRSPTRSPPIEPDLVVLAGFMRILGARRSCSRFRIVNTHPALLPAFPGAHAMRDALAAGVDTTGVTVHWVDEGVDTGPIIAQAAVADRARRRRGLAARAASRPSRNPCTSTPIRQTHARRAR